MRVDCRTCVLGIPFLPAILARQKRVSARGIHDESRFPDALLAIRVDGRHFVVAIRHLFHGGNPGFFRRRYACGFAVFEQQIIELGPAHLECVVRAFAQRPFEIEGLVARTAPGNRKIGPQLRHTDFPDLIQHTETLDNGQIHWQQ